MSLSDPALLVVHINSGSSLVVKTEVIHALHLENSDVSQTTDSAGNITSISFNVERASLHSSLLILATLPGISSISTPGLAEPRLNAQLDDVVAWALSSDISIQFAEGIDGLNGPLGVNRYSGPKEGTVVDLLVTSGHGIASLLNSESSVTLTASGGHTPLINGQSGPVIVKFAKGAASVTVSDSASGTVTLAMSSPEHPSVDLAVDSASVALA